MAAAEAKDAGLGGLDDDSGATGTIQLIGQDSKEFTVEKKHAFISTLVATSLETDQDATSIPIPGVKGEVLEKVVEYMQHHAGTEPAIIEKPLRSKHMKDVVKDPWDATFIDTIGNDRQSLYDLILAANYMDIRSLLHLGCAKVASLIKGQPLEKIKGILDPNAKQEPAADEKKA